MVTHLPKDPFFSYFFRHLNPDIAATFTEAQLDAVKRAFGTRYSGSHAIDLRLSLPLKRHYYLVVLGGKERRSPEKRQSRLVAAQSQQASNDPFVSRFFCRITPEMAATFTEAQLAALKEIFGDSVWHWHRIDQRHSIRCFRRFYYLVVVAGQERRSPGRRADERRQHPLWTVGNALAMAIAGLPFCFGIGLGAGAIINQPDLLAQVLSPFVIDGVPVPILLKAAGDDKVREAYWSGDRQQLHDRLSDMGVEEDIKEYYGSQVTDDEELDQKIHQIFYNQTGYVGDSYDVNSAGRLEPKPESAR